MSTINVYLNKPNEEKFINRKEIANQLADEIKFNSSAKNVLPTNFISDNTETYTTPFSSTELEDSQ